MRIVDKNVMTEISASLLQSSSVHLDSWSLLGLIILVAALTVLCLTPMHHGTIAIVSGEPELGKLHFLTMTS